MALKTVQIRIEEDQVEYVEKESKNPIHGSVSAAVRSIIRKQMNEVKK